MTTLTSATHERIMADFRRSLASTLSANSTPDEQAAQEQQAEARRIIIEFRYTRLTTYERLMKQIDRALGRNVQRGGVGRSPVWMVDQVHQFEHRTIR